MKGTSTSSPTRSASGTEAAGSETAGPIPCSVVVALGSNLGPRRFNILRAVHELRGVMRVVRVSSIRESAAVGAPPDSPPFLNAVAIGHTRLGPRAFLDGLLAIEKRLGRVRRGVVNEARGIDLDLILHGGHRMATVELTLPHPRAALRPFVIEPLRELGLEVWIPAAGAGRAGPAIASPERRPHRR